jgi:hypothetical protein
LNAAVEAVDWRLFHDTQEWANNFHHASQTGRHVSFYVGDCDVEHDERGVITKVSGKVKIDGNAKKVNWVGRTVLGKIGCDFGVISLDEKYAWIDVLSPHLEDKDGRLGWY